MKKLFFYVTSIQDGWPLLLKRWEDAKEYFLQYNTSKKEYKQTLSNNKRYQRIQSVLKSENRMFIQIKFLVGVAPLLSKYLKVFQAEWPLVHVLYIEMKSLVTLMKRFLEAGVVNEKKAMELQTCHRWSQPVTIEGNRYWIWSNKSIKEIKKGGCYLAATIDAKMFYKNDSISPEETAN